MATTILSAAPTADITIPDDLPYAIATAEQTGGWQFSDGETHTISVDEYDPADERPWTIVADGITQIDNVSRFQTKAEADAALEALTNCSFIGDGGSDVTATRAYALQDRAVNAVSISADAALEFPAKTAGKVRDFGVRLSDSGSHTITVAAEDAGGDAVTLLSTPTFFDGGVFSFTEVAQGDFVISEPFVQVDWNETANTSPAFIKNKPNIPAAQVNSDWNSLSGISQILNKPSPYASSPEMDGTASPGTGTAYALGDHRHPSDTSKADKSDVEPLLFKQWYPDGSVTSSSQFTSGIKYDFDTTNKTAMVKPFAYTGDANDSNLDLVGAVVIPPYVETNGTRYVVVGISGTGYYIPEGESNLSSIIAPTTIKSIGGYAFNSCASLSSVSIPAATSIGGSAFSSCTSLTSVSFPAATSIGENAFLDCTSLTSVSFPAATSIGGSAFSSCTSLTSVSFPAATSIGQYAFAFCTSFLSVSLPAATNIGSSAFYNCTSLSSVSLPEATSIGSSAFYNCTSLGLLDFGSSVRSSVPAISSDTFTGVTITRLTVVVPDPQYDAWITTNGWVNLYNNGAKFYKHSEWEAPHRYELDYAMVTPETTVTFGDDWQFSGSGMQTGHVYSVEEQFQEDGSEGAWYYTLYDDGLSLGWPYFSEERQTVVEFDGTNITATRDCIATVQLEVRAINGITLLSSSTNPDTSAVTVANLVLPPSGGNGRVRDMLVRMNLEGTGDLPDGWRLNIVGNTPSGGTQEAVTLETEDGEMPSASERGSYLLSITETVSGSFAVSMKPLKAVQTA